MEQEFYIGDLVVIKDLDYLTKHQNEAPTITAQMRKAHDQECIVKSVWDNGRRISLTPLDESFLSCVDEFSWRTSWVIASSEHKTSEDFMKHFQDLFD